MKKQKKKDRLLEILSDKYCRVVLKSIMSTPKSATEVTAETKIPISTVYRRIQTLYDNKLLRNLELLQMKEKNYSCIKVKSKEFKVRLMTDKLKLT